jgi:hypothetical protein
MTDARPAHTWSAQGVSIVLMSDLQVVQDDDELLVAMDPEPRTFTGVCTGVALSVEALDAEVPGDDLDPDELEAVAGELVRADATELTDPWLLDVAPVELLGRRGVRHVLEHHTHGRPATVEHHCTVVGDRVIALLLMCGTLEYDEFFADQFAACAASLRLEDDDG